MMSFLQNLFIQGILLVFVIPGALGQTGVLPASQKQNSIRELIEITGGDAISELVIEQIVADLRPLVELSFPNVPPNVMDELFEELNAEMRQVDIVTLVSPIYERHFTQEEIEGLIEFYKTPLGQRTIELMPIVIQESMEVGRVWGEQAGRRAAETILQRLEERGYQREE